MSSRGPYDHSVENSEAIGIYQSDKDKDYESAVTDGIQDTRISTEIEKRITKLKEQ